MQACLTDYDKGHMLFKTCVSNIRKVFYIEHTWQDWVNYSTS